MDRKQDIKYAESYYIDVHDYGGKADVLEGLLDSLDPKLTIIMVKSDESAVQGMIKLGH